MRSFLTFLLMFIVLGSVKAQIAQWKFDERSGSTNNIAFIGDSSLDINSSTQIVRGVTGPAGYYRALLGTNAQNYIATDTLVTGTNSDADLRITGKPGITLAFWIKSPTNLAGYATLVDQGNASYENYGVEIKTNAISFVMSDGTKRRIENTTTNFLLFTNWTHIAVTLSGPTNYSSNSVSFYVNGFLLPTNSNSLAEGTLDVSFGLVSCTNKGPVVVMNQADTASPAKGWKGSFDDLRIYSNALSQAAISNAFTIPTSPISTNEYYIGTASRIYDASGIRYYVDNATSSYGTNVVDWINKSGGTLTTNKVAAGFINASDLASAASAGTNFAASVGNSATNYTASMAAGITNGGYTGVITNLSTLSTNIFAYRNGVVTNATHDP